MSWKKKNGKSRTTIWWWWRGGILPTRDQKYFLVIGENDGGKEIRYCNYIFGPDTCITNAALEALRFIRNKGGGGR